MTTAVDGDSATPSSVAPRRAGRSPSYPGIDLELAVRRAGELWKHEHHYPAAVETILGHWGYGAKSGGGFAAVAALKSFGLLEYEGSGAERKAWLSTLAQDILTAENEETRRSFVRKAALEPPVHAMLWERYESRLPSDTSLELFLTRERNFTPSGASELVSEWKRTLVYAGLTDDPGSAPSQTGDSAEKANRREEPRVTPPPVIGHESARDPGARDEQEAREQPRSQRTKRTIQVPYAPSAWALLEASFPMTEEEWQQMLAVLQAMKVGLVQRV